MLSEKHNSLRTILFSDTISNDTDTYMYIHTHIYMHVYTIVYTHT